MPKLSAPIRLYVAAGQDGAPVGPRCLSARGASKHCRRPRRRVPGVHVAIVSNGDHLKAVQS